MRDPVRVQIIGSVNAGGRVLEDGDVVELPRYDAEPLIAAGHARKVGRKDAPKPDRPTKKGEA